MCVLRIALRLTLAGADTQLICGAFPVRRDLEGNIPYEALYQLAVIAPKTPVI